MVIAVLILFPVILQTVINLRMMFIRGQGAILMPRLRPITCKKQG